MFNGFQLVSTRIARVQVMGNLPTQKDQFARLGRCARQRLGSLLFGVSENICFSLLLPT